MPLVCARSPAPALTCADRVVQTPAGSFVEVPPVPGPVPLPEPVAVPVFATVEGAGSWETLNSVSRALLKPKKYVATKPAT